MALTDDELRALYAVRPDEFVRARNERVRALKKAGRRDDADRLATLRRPSAIAWSLNCVARERPQLVDAWHDAATALRDAMQRAVRGRADDVRPAQAAERKATEAVVTAARRKLEELGQRDNDVAAQRIASTVRAASLDDQLSQRLRTATLEGDAVASGFGFGAMTADETLDGAATRRGAAASKRSETRDWAAERTARTQTRDRAGQAARTEARDRAEQAARRAEAKRLAATASRLAAAADKAQRMVDDLRSQSEQLHQRLRDAERDARRARSEADRAAAAAQRAVAQSED